MNSTADLRLPIAPALLLALVLSTPGAPAFAQDNYPSRSVKIIAPQAPGGGVDLGASWEGYAIEEVLKALRPDDAYYWATHNGGD